VNCVLVLSYNMNSLGDIFIKYKTQTSVNLLKRSLKLIFLEINRILTICIKI